MLRHEDGHVIVETLFCSEFSKEKEFPDAASTALTVDIDDCECPSCERNRGNLQMYATMGVSIHTTDGIHTQRLVPSEARHLAEVLMRFAQVIEDVSDADPSEWVSKEMA